MSCLLSTSDLGIDWERGFVFSFWLTFYNQEKIIPMKLLPNITSKRTENMAHQQGPHAALEAIRGPMQQGIKWNLPPMTHLRSLAGIDDCFLSQHIREKMRRKLQTWGDCTSCSYRTWPEGLLASFMCSVARDVQLTKSGLLL